jgi:hypothetical protein
MRLKSYLLTQKLQAYPASINQEVVPGEYLWIHGLDHRGWLLTPEKRELAVGTPVWKQRLDDVLEGRAYERG